MKHSPFLCIASTLVFIGCTSLSPEAALKQELNAANYCDVPADCELIGSKCPFDCYIYVNKKEAAGLKGKVEAFQSDCTYSCIATKGVACVEHQCAAIPGDPDSVERVEENIEGNVGEACTSNDDCITPMSFLTRSSCPFGSQCVEGKCAVTCEMSTYDSSRGVTDPVQCTADSDCDCKGYVANDSQDCRCLSGQCAAVVAK